MTLRQYLLLSVLVPPVAALGAAALVYAFGGPGPSQFRALVACSALGAVPYLVLVGFGWRRMRNMDELQISKLALVMPFLFVALALLSLLTVGISGADVSGLASPWWRYLPGVGGIGLAVAVVWVVVLNAGALVLHLYRVVSKHEDVV